MLGVELAARFALPPNSRSYCGTPSFRKAFAGYMGDKCAKNRRNLERELKKFTAHYAYLCLIARANGLSQFDRKVAGAFWIGNGLLKKPGRSELQKLIMSEFSGDGMLTAQRSRELAEELPRGFAPHHSFHVLYLHTISGVVEPSVENADLCRISWGRVMQAGRGKVEVHTQRLERRGGKLCLSPCRKRWDTGCEGIELVPGAEAGELLASHWGVAVMKLTQSQGQWLEKYTAQNIAAANRL